MTAVKVCGVTRAADAALAVELGASAVGMIFWAGSPRFVDRVRAGEIVAAIPDGVLRVGVFVDASEDVRRDTAEALGLDVVQVHDATPVTALSGHPRVFKLIGRDDVRDAAAWPAHVTPLIDAVDPVRRGGTGRVADWSTAAQLSSARPIVLAGGLSSDNVADAISRVRPWAVDVSSGVEQAPGIKDPARMRAFFAAVAAADRP